MSHIYQLGRLVNQYQMSTISVLPAPAPLASDRPHALGNQVARIEPAPAKPDGTANRFTA
jgi:hypothetical protein